MTRFLTALFFAICIFPAASAATRQTFLSIDSQPGDFVGAGMIQTFTPSDGTLTVQGSTSYIQVFFYTPTFSSYWSLTFRPATGQLFTPGIYEAQRFPSNTASMDVSGNHRGCNRETGRFLISDLAFNADGTLNRTAIDLEQHCEGEPPALYGSVRFNSTVTVVPRFSVSDAVVLKGNAGTSDGYVTVSLSMPSAQALKVRYDVDDGTAKSDRDYVYVSGTAQFQPGVTSQTVIVPIIGNRTVRGNRTLQFFLSPQKGVSIGDGTAKVTIVDPNSPITAFAINSPPGDFVGAGQNLQFTAPGDLFSASRNYDNGVSVMVDFPIPYWSADFSAPGNDPLVPGGYENAQRFPFQTFGAPGLSIDGDGRGCNTLSGRFVVDDAAYSTTGDVLRFGAEFEQSCEMFMPPMFGSVRINSVPRQLSISNALRSSGPSAVFTVTLNPASTDTVSVNFSTVDGTALASTDYTSTSWTVTFLPGETAHAVSVPLLGSYRGKRFYGQLSSPSGRTLWISRGTAAF